MYFLGIPTDDKTFHLNVNGVEKVYELTNFFGVNGPVTAFLELPTALNYLSFTITGYNYGIKNLEV